MWLLTPFLRDPAGDTLTSRMAREGAKAPGSLMTYWQVVKTLRGTYEANDTVARS